MKIFISYTMVDLLPFRIPEIADFLESQSDIKRVYYWDRDCDAEKSIVTYMEESIKLSDRVICICTKNSIDSGPVRQELEMAVYLNKTIIPIFQNIEDVTLSLRTKRGVKFDEDFQSFLEQLYFILTGHKSITNSTYYSEKMNDITPIYTALGEPLGTTHRKRIHEEPLWHKTILIFIVYPTGKILYIRRSSRSRINPNLFDCFGGHLKNKETYREATKRELAEELGIPRKLIKDDELIQIGEDGQFKVQIDYPHYKNYEISTLFLFFLGLDLIVNTQETFGKESEILIRYGDYLDQLAEKYNQDPALFADGISRILSQKEIIQQINELIQNRIKISK